MILEANRIEVRSSFKAHPDRIIIPCESRKEAEKLKKQILYALKDYEIDYKGMARDFEKLYNESHQKVVLSEKVRNKISFMYNGAEDEILGKKK